MNPHRTLATVPEDTKELTLTGAEARKQSKLARKEKLIKQTETAAKKWNESQEDLKTAIKSGVFELTVKGSYDFSGGKILANYIRKQGFFAQVKKTGIYSHSYEVKVYWDKLSLIVLFLSTNAKSIVATTVVLVGTLITYLTW